MPSNKAINTRINFHNSDQKTLKITTIMSTIFVTFQMISCILIVLIRFKIDKREKSEHIYNQPLTVKSYSSEMKEEEDNNGN